MNGYNLDALKTAFQIAIILLVLFIVLRPAYAASQGNVLIVKISSDISRRTAELVTRSIEEAEAGGVRLIIYELNTPGGDLSSVTSIMNKSGSSQVPVLVWVTPQGATAWSGGTYILMASHIAVMASGNNHRLCPTSAIHWRDSQSIKIH
jgi:membrane-bound serine protease (ClpP class)